MPDTVVPTPVDTSTQGENTPAGSAPEIDIAAVSADIGKSLFERNRAFDGKAAATPEPVKPVNEVAPEPRVEAGQNSVAPVVPPVSAKALPKSYKKELEATWGSLPAPWQDAIIERDANAMRGLNQYSTSHKQWTELTTPFQPILDANPQVNPVQLMQGLLNTHLQLLNPASSNEAKAGLIGQLLKEYGITLGAAAPGTEIPAGVQTELQTLRQELAAIKNIQQTAQQREMQDSVARYTAEIEAFAAKPENKYFQEVGTDILRLVKLDPSLNLKDAYETACWSNPTIRAKMLADTSVNQPNGGQQPQRNGKGQFVNVDTSADQPIRAPAKGSMMDTINGVIAKHQSSAKH